jgi:MoaA/NifB/PqqE/SkfB family radical SAM enzyme
LLETQGRGPIRLPGGAGETITAVPRPSRSQADAKPLHLPRCLYLEITDKCNMNCPMCITRAYRGWSGEALLSYDEIVGGLLKPFRQLGGKHFVVSGGEPMLSPIVPEVLREADALGLNITFASNILSEGLHCFEDILMAIDDNRHGFQFSFDSIVREEMNRIRGRDVYDQVLDSIRKIVSLRKEHGYKARLFAQLVLQEDNLASVFDTVRFLLDDVGVDGCEIQPRVEYSNVTIENYRAQAFPSYSEEVRSRFLTAVRMLTAMASSDRRLLVEGRTYDNWERFLRNPLDLKGPCNSRNMILVGAYGHFRGCLFSPTTGNVRSMSIGEYLRGRPRMQFLKLAEVCKICINGCT